MKITYDLCKCCGWKYPKSWKWILPHGACFHCDYKAWLYLKYNQIEISGRLYDANQFTNHELGGLGFGFWKLVDIMRANLVYPKRW